VVRAWFQPHIPNKHLNFYSPPGPSWSVLGRDLPYTPNMHPDLSQNLQNLIPNFFLEHRGKDYFLFELHDQFVCCPVGRYSYESFEFWMSNMSDFMQSTTLSGGLAVR